ncbi:hypothetical protein GF318_03660 [Candidatus Micrarchaeota archaeon]|nr:hypothetical protein [Candidatus Micrarchaeota archaeon]
MGKAHAFFGCKAGKEKVQRELEKLKTFLKIPPQLELSLKRGPKSVGGGITLLAIATAADSAGTEYALEASCRGKSNEEVADELAKLMNLFPRTDLKGKAEELSFQIVFKNGDEYVFRDST